MISNETLIEHLRRDGGMTLRVYGPAMPAMFEVHPDTGFAVGSKNLSYSWQAIEDLGLRELVYACWLAWDKPQYMGLWVSNNRVHVDAVQIVETLPHALVQARVFEQKAIYSFAAKASLYLEQPVSKDDLLTFIRLVRLLEKAWSWDKNTDAETIALRDFANAVLARL